MCPLRIHDVVTSLQPHRYCPIDFQAPCRPTLHRLSPCSVSFPAKFYTSFSDTSILTTSTISFSCCCTRAPGTRQQHTSSLTLQRPLLFNDSLYHISNSSHVVNIYPEQSALRQPGLLAHKIPPLILAAGAGEWQEFAKENMEMNEGEHKHTSGAPFTLTVMAMPVRWFPLIRQSSAITPTMMPLQTLAIDPRHQQSLPAPKTKKRTVAELAADEAIAAQEQAFMLIMDERHNVSGPAAKAGTTDGEAGTATFEPRFETWQAIKKIRAEHKERAEREAEAKAQLADILTYIQADLGMSLLSIVSSAFWLTAQSFDQLHQHQPFRAPFSPSSLMVTGQLSCFLYISWHLVLFFSPLLIVQSSASLRCMAAGVKRSTKSAPCYLSAPAFLFRSECPKPFHPLYKNMALPGKEGRASA